MVALLHDNKHELRLVVLPAGGDTGAADGGHLVRGCCVVRAVARWIVAISLAWAPGLGLGARGCGVGGLGARARVGCGVWCGVG